MSLPGHCAGGCGPERKLELVAGSELDEVIDLEHEAERRAQALADMLSRFLALPVGKVSTEMDGLARAVLHAHDRDFPAATAALAAEPEPVVSWWCDRCGGVDAPAPCVGVCVRRPAQWASLDALQRRRAATATRLQDEQRLARAVRTWALTRARPGSEGRHREAVRHMAAQALAEHCQHSDKLRPTTEPACSQSPIDGGRRGRS